MAEDMDKGRRNFFKFAAGGLAAAALGAQAKADEINKAFDRADALEPAVTKFIDGLKTLFKKHSDLPAEAFTPDSQFGDILGKLEGEYLDTYMKHFGLSPQARTAHGDLAGLTYAADSVKRLPHIDRRIYEYLRLRMLDDSLENEDERERLYQAPRPDREA
jgi:hypothetical protein